MDLLLKLVTIHFISDFALQSEYIALNKGKVPIVMIAHCAIHAGLSWWVVGCHPLAWVVLVGIFFSHMFIDYTKCKNHINLLQDQLLHLLVIALLAFFLTSRICPSACPFTHTS